MKRALPLLLVVAAALSCRKAPAPSATSSTTSMPAAAGTQSTGGVPNAAAPNAPGQPNAIKPMPAQLPAVLARVNGEEIGRWEFDVAVKRVEQRAGGPVP